MILPSHNSTSVTSATEPERGQGRTKVCIPTKVDAESILTAIRRCLGCCEAKPRAPAADTSVHPATTTHPGRLEVNTLSGDDEQMGEEHVETGFRPVSVTLPFRGKSST